MLRFKTKAGNQVTDWFAPLGNISTTAWKELHARTQKQRRERENQSTDPVQSADSAAAHHPQRRDSLPIVVEQLEFYFNDRRSFEEFVDHGFIDTIPDAKNIDLFKKRGLERLK